MTNDSIRIKLKKQFHDLILDSSEFRGEETFLIPPEHIHSVCQYLKEDEDLSFNILADLCGIDMATAEKRFGVIYNLYSLKTKHRIRLKTFVEEEHPRVQSVTDIWSTANWHERETYDMYGIHFEGHPDLRRIYMPDEFSYYPLRKDFPLMGIPGSMTLPKK